MLDRLRHDDFDSRIGDVFTIAVEPDGAIELRLIETTLLGGGGAAGGRDPFSLLFRGGPVDHHLPQGIYDLTHPSMGVVGLFLVPLGPDTDGMRYEAVFN